MYIVFFLLMAANLLAQESYVIDSVCVGAERTYRRDGEKLYLYDWHIIDRQLTDTFEVPEIPFEEVLGSDTTWGSQISHTWDAEGDYDILVYVTSEHGCDTVEQGVVRVFPLPEARAGEDVVLCNIEDYTLFGDTAWNHSVIYWGRTGDGTFDNEYTLHPTYSFGPNDILEGKVTLFITAEGLADNGTCIPAVDSVIIMVNPSITIDSTAVLCYGQSVPDWEGQEVSSIADSVYTTSYPTLSGCDSTLTLTVSIVDGFSYDSTAVLCYGQSVPDWEGQEVSSIADSVYTTSYPTLSGCDSTLTLTVSIVDGFSYDSTAVLCYGQSVPDWEGQEVSSIADSVYTTSYPTLSGCDSTLTLTVSIVDGFSYDSTAVLCYGQSVPDWEGQEVSSIADSVYTTSYPILSGCDSTLTLTVSIVDGFSYDSTAVLCYGQSVPDWEGQEVSSIADSVYTTSYPTLSGCDSTLTLTVSIVDGFSYDSTAVLCYGQSVPDWEGQEVSSIADSVYTTSYPTLSGCDSTLTLTVSIVDGFSYDSTAVLCYGQSVPDWEGQEVSSIADSVYTTSYPTLSGCDSTLTLTVSIVDGFSYDSTAVLCYGQSVPDWEGQEVSSIADSVYTTSYPTLSGCDSTLTLTVSIVDGFSYDSTAVLCYGQSVPDWEGQEVSSIADSVYTTSYPILSGCDSTLTLTISIINGGLTEVYESACVEFTWTAGNDSTYYQSGIYDYITGESECADTMRLHLVISPPILLDTIITDVLCYGDSNGAVDLVVNGGIEPYTFLWSNGETTQNISGLLAGTYTVAVADSLGCEATITVEVTEPTEIQITLDTVIDVTLAGASTGSIEVSVEGGTPDYNYQWTNEAGVVVGEDEDLNNQPAGDYTLTVTDANDCQNTLTATIIQPSLLKFEDVGLICQYSPAPELPDTALNGTPGYWLDTISTAIAGDFELLFFPESGYHAAPFSLTITIIPAINLNVDPVDPGYDPNPEGRIYMNISGGSEPYTINWTYPDGSTATTANIANLYAGDYWVEVSDNIGCYDSLSVSLRAFEPEFSCPPDTIFECPDVTQYPPPTNIAEFIAMGGYYNPANIVDNITYFDNQVSSEYCLTIERTYVIEDIYGRLDSCTQTIDFHDTIPPVIIAPEGDTAECYSSVFSDFKTYADFIASGVPVIDDNCGIDPSSFSVHDTLINIEPGRSELIYYYSIADICGNIGRDTTYFLLLDDKAPEVFCADITVYLDENGQYQLTIQDSITMVDSIYDNCTAPEDMEVVIEIKEITCEDVESGTQARIMVYDQVGLSAECVANITVVDTTPPVAVCQPVTIYLDENGQAGVTAEMIDNGSFDNCTDVTLELNRTDFDCVNLGDNTVTLTVTDGYGLQDSCEAVVMVLDTIAPQISCISRDTVQLSEEDGTYTLTYEMITTSEWENCEIVSRELDRYILDCEDIEASPVTITAFATDQSGNVGTCTAEFVVFGNTPPNVQNDSAITAMNIAVEIPVTNNDYDLKTNINLESLGVLVGPRNGSVVIDKTTGSAMYTPDRDFVGEDIFYYEICDDGIPCEPECGQAIVFVTVLPANNPPDAVDDYFEVPCGELFGNVLYGDDFGNGVDSDPDDGDKITVGQTLISPPDSGVFNWLDGDGNFEYIPYDGFFGTDSFQYVICDDGIPTSLCDTAWVYITRVPDNDCDGVADTDDIDDDNDGIRDNIENGGSWPEDQMGLIDSDHDGIPDYMDIDSDNDGIPDNIEGQGEHNYIPPSGRDSDGDGWDDVYNVDIGGVYTFDIDLTDTDGDSMPDYLDIDSDNDGVFDMIEGHDADHNGIADVLRWYSDEDHDGLDDAYDTYSGWADYGNEIGSNAPLQDFDDDGTRDWRDINDEDDDYLTVNEDLNGNGDYSDDDLDLDGYPEYLDTELNCELFIPEGFSPNDDGVHDFFQILCIQKYPNAKLMIFNRNGVKLWEKEHYGNLDVWGTYYDAWWWGTSEHAFTIGRSGGLPAGNYIYVLILNDGLGTVKNGTVMLAY